jgi:GT2 family glycosyltransferase
MKRDKRRLKQIKIENGTVVESLNDEIKQLRENLSETRKAVNSLVETNKYKDHVLNQIEETWPLISYRIKVLRQLSEVGHTARRSVPQISSELYFAGSQMRSRRPSAQIPRLSWGRARSLAKLPLFDEIWYLSQNPDVARSGANPRHHFLRHGAFERRDPHPLISSYWCLIANDEFPSDVPAVLAYHEQPSIYETHPLFDADFYKNKNRHAAICTGALNHFISTGAKQMLDPHPLIHMQRLAQQLGLAASENVLLDYLTAPENFLASPHPLFDPEYYLSENPDVCQMGVNPLLHYCSIGWREGRQPNRLFAGDWYLMANPDVLKSGQNPLLHYVLSGWIERRMPHPMFDPKFYLSLYSDVRSSGTDALTHYLEEGAWEERETTPEITVESMRKISPENAWRLNDPITAFLGFGIGELTLPTSFRLPETRTSVTSGSTSFWPPNPTPVYWLPQALRNYIVSRYGEEKVDRYSFLMSVIDKFETKQKEFNSSPEIRTLLQRVKYLSTQASLRSGCRASVIIPVFNNLVFTLTCVASILEDEVDYGFEILIGDDGSTDGTDTVFCDIGGCVKLVRHQKNYGFLGNCNATAKFAASDVFVFLNNDTLVLPGWLDGLIRLLDNHPEYGLVGSKLLNSDGTLQEAGGIFWSDGSAWNYGRNQDPSLPEFNYLKPVDYISGASIAMRRNDWLRLEGFDTIFSPAYCEDSDLAFRVRAVSLEAVYMPHSEVIHHEGRSHGRDTASGIKAYQVVNQAKMVDQWGKLFQEKHFPNAQDVFLARDRSRDKKHLLVVDHYIPQWDRDAGSRCMLHVMRMFLNAGFHVTFWPDNLFEDKPYCRVLQEMGVEVIYSNFYKDRFVDFMRENGKYFNYAILSRPHISIKFYEKIRSYSKAKIFYYGHDVHFARMQMELHSRQATDENGAVEQMKLLEMSNWRMADAVLYPSIEECELVGSVAPGVEAYPVPIWGFTAAEMERSWRKLERNEGRDQFSLLFVGGSHPPNVDALDWFLNCILPLVIKQSPMTKLRVVGSADTRRIPSELVENVKFLGRLSDDDLELEYAKCGVAIVPLRFGAGVKGKSIEAMLNAIPLLTTRVGLQGIDSEEPLAFLANTAEEFAQSVLSIQADPSERFVRAKRALQFLQSNYTEHALKGAFASIVCGLQEPMRH